MISDLGSWLQDLSWKRYCNRDGVLRSRHFLYLPSQDRSIYPMIAGAPARDLVNPSPRGSLGFIQNPMNENVLYYPIQVRCSRLNGNIYFWKNIVLTKLNLEPQNHNFSNWQSKWDLKSIKPEQTCYHPKINVPDLLALSILHPLHWSKYIN